MWNYLENGACLTYKEKDKHFKRYLRVIMYKLDWMFSLAAKIRIRIGASVDVFLSPVRRRIIISHWANRFKLGVYYQVVCTTFKFGKDWHTFEFGAGMLYCKPTIKLIMELLSTQ